MYNYSRGQLNNYKESSRKTRKLFCNKLAFMIFDKLVFSCSNVENVTAYTNKFIFIGPINILYGSRSFTAKNF